MNGIYTTFDFAFAYCTGLFIGIWIGIVLYKIFK